MIFLPHKLGFIDIGFDRPALKSPIYCWIGFSACGELSSFAPSMYWCLLSECIFSVG